MTSLNYFIIFFSINSFLMFWIQYNGFSNAYETNSSVQTVKRAVIWSSHVIKD